MNIRAGLFLESMQALEDTFFAGAVLYLSEYNNKGAVGYIINRPFGRSLHQLQEFRHSPLFPLYEGGPVDTEHLFFLHRRPDLIGESTEVAGGIYWGGNCKQAVRGINNKSLSVGDLKIFVGYCGWDTGDLEAEIEEGSWILSELGSEAVFRPAD